MCPRTEPSAHVARRSTAHGASRRGKWMCGRLPTPTSSDSPGTSTPDRHGQTPAIGGPRLNLGTWGMIQRSIKRLSLRALIVDDELPDPTAEGRATRALVQELQ